MARLLLRLHVLLCALFLLVNHHRHGWSSFLRKLFRLGSIRNARRSSFSPSLPNSFHYLGDWGTTRTQAQPPTCAEQVGKRKWIDRSSLHLCAAKARTGRARSAVGTGAEAGRDRWKERIRFEKLSTIPSISPPSQTARSSTRQSLRSCQSVYRLEPNEEGTRRVANGRIVQRIDREAAESRARHRSTHPSYRSRLSSSPR